MTDATLLAIAYLPVVISGLIIGFVVGRIERTQKRADRIAALAGPQS